LPGQALERLGGLLESEGGSITLLERGDLETVPRAPGFRLFAAMNPATDAGGGAPPVHCMHLSCMGSSDSQVFDNVACISALPVGIILYLV
jgi:hypothetical protein